MDISLAIGRNVDDVPMLPERWEAYRDRLDELVKRHGFEIYNTENGLAVYRPGEPRPPRPRGLWESEQSYRVFAREAVAAQFSRVTALTDALSALAEEYGQWGIALSFVATSIIRPKVSS